MVALVLVLISVGGLAVGVTEFVGVVERQPLDQGSEESDGA